MFLYQLRKGFDGMNFPDSMFLGVELWVTRGLTERMILAEGVEMEWVIVSAA